MYWGACALTPPPERPLKGSVGVSCHSLFRITVPEELAACQCQAALPFLAPAHPGHRLFSRILLGSSTTGPAGSSPFLMERPFQQGAVSKCSRTRHCSISPLLIMGDSHSTPVPSWPHLLPFCLALRPLPRPSARLSQLFCPVPGISKLCLPSFSVRERFKFCIITFKFFFL